LIDVLDERFSFLREGYLPLQRKAEALLLLLTLLLLLFVLLLFWLVRLSLAVAARNPTSHRAFQIRHSKEMKKKILFK
jgi:hypothetical protein